MSESAEQTPAPPGPVAPAAPSGQPGSAQVQGTRLRRRPTGTAPPLPHPISLSTTAWVLNAVVIVACAFLFSVRTPWLRVDDQVNTWLLLRLADVRTPWLTDVANGINAAGNGWAVPVVGVSVVVLIMVFRRWRHLAVFLGSLFFLEEGAGQWIYEGLTRPRPYGVTIIGSWGGYSAPSVPVAAVTIFLVAAVYCLVVPGRPRGYAKAAAAVIIAVFCLARLYLAVDHPDDVLFGVALAVAIPVAAFRYFTPNEIFPIVYRRGRTAHVDVGGRRGDAIQLAAHDQLGLTLLEIKPVGLESSAGSTPLRLRVEGGPEEYLFAKL
jgi:membrane-associated phospholipid phosphatase